MKPIKFDLPLNGTKIATLEQLEENLTPEILEPFRSGKLAKWLRVRSLDEQAGAVEALLAADVQYETQLFKKLCEVFEREVDEDDAREMIEAYKTSLPSLSKVIDDDLEAIKVELQRQKELQKIGNFELHKTNGVAIDTQTRLMWLRFAIGQNWENGTAVGSGITMNYRELTKLLKIAEMFNTNGGYAGHTDWRLPTCEEFKTLIDKVKGKEGNYIDADVFPNNNAHDSYGGYWTSSLDYEYEDGSRRTVTFQYGIDSSLALRGRYAVRLVRGE